MKPAGYSGTPLPQKLGIKEGHVVALERPPEGFGATLGKLPPNVRLVFIQRRGAPPPRLSLRDSLRSRCARVEDSPGRNGDFDVILLFVRDRKALEAKLTPTIARMAPDTSLWICWPKKTSPLASDVDENVVRERGLSSGIVDIKICAVDQDWSGLKFMFRLKDRPAIRASKARKKK